MKLLVAAVSIIFSVLILTSGNAASQNAIKPTAAGQAAVCPNSLENGAPVILATLRTDAERPRPAPSLFKGSTLLAQSCASGNYYYITYFCGCGGACCSPSGPYLCHNDCSIWSRYEDMPDYCTSYSVGTLQ